MIYHRPGQKHYDVTVADECFATAAQGEAARYRAAKGRPRHDDPDPAGIAWRHRR